MVDFGPEGCLFKARCRARIGLATRVLRKKHFSVIFEIFWDEHIVSGAARMAYNGKEEPVGQRLTNSDMFHQIEYIIEASSYYIKTKLNQIL